METLGSKFDKFLEQELKDDYRNLNDDCYNNQLKKQLSQKYGMESRKTADIQKEILLGIQEKRSLKNTLSGEDISWWHRLYPNIDTYNNLKEALRHESELFVGYLSEYFKKEKEDAEYEGRRRYVLSGWDKTRIHRYNNIVRYLNEKRNSEDKNLQDLIKSLDGLTQSFREKYLDDTRQYAERKWDGMKKKADGVREQIRDLCRENCQSKETRDKVWKLQRQLSSLDIVVSRPKNEYADSVVKDAERTFSRDIETIAHRVRQKGIDETNISVSPIRKDYVGIEMYIGDGNRGLWARAIVAAENSMYMRPHYRFIVTEKKDEYKITENE